jgi:hypothetical protein
MQQNRILFVEIKRQESRLRDMDNKPASEAINQAERELKETQSLVD